MWEKLFGLERNFDNAIVTFRLLALLVHAVARSSLVIEDARRSQGRNDQTSLSDNPKSLQLSGRRGTTQVMNTTFKTDVIIIHLFTFLLLFSFFRLKLFAYVSPYMLFLNQVPWTKSSRNIKFNYRREKYYKKTLMFSLLNIKFIKYVKVTQIKYNIKGFFILKFLLCLKDMNYVTLFTFTLLTMKLLSWNRRKLFLCLW